MTSHRSVVLAALLGDGHPDIVRACASGDAVTAEYVLRTGRAPGAIEPAALEPPADRAGLWSRVARMSRDREGQGEDAGLAVLLSTLHRLGKSFALKVSQRDGQLETYLGWSDTADVDWVQRLLAPRILLDPPVAATDRTTAASYVIRFRQAPDARGVPAGDGPHRPPMLERLAAVSAGYADVIVRAVPASGADVQRAMLELSELHRSVAASMSRTRVVDEVTNASLTDPAAERIVEWLCALIDDLGRMRAIGGWRTDIVVSAADSTVAAQLAATLTAGDPQPADHPPRIWIADAFTVGSGPAGYSATSILDSRQLAELAAPPRAARGGIDVGPPPPSDRRSLPARRPLWLGNWAGTAERAVLDVDDLAGHAFLAGVTGSGKTTTVSRLVLAAWNQHGVPFLIVDPVKDDYTTLASLTRGGLTVRTAADLRFNILQPVPGIPIATHMAHISAAFKGAFSMPSPVPYVATLLFDDIADRCAAGDSVTLHDLRQAVRPLVERLGYRGELEGNVLASLGVRLSVLCAPSRAERLCASQPVEDLFTTPTVVTLADVGDEEERAFLMSVLAIYLAEHARVRPGAGGAVTHICVLEEAHRIASEPGSSSEERGNAAGHAAQLVAGLLAEIRSYGESVVLLDQSPAAVAREVTRNTNTKIVHRILDPADRAVLGGAMGLDDEDNGFFAGLAAGSAVVTTARLARPQLVQIAPPFVAVDGFASVRPAAPAGRVCCGRDAIAHHRAEDLAADAGWIALEALTAVAATRTPANAARADVVRRRFDRLAARHSGVLTNCLLQVGSRVASEAWRRGHDVDTVHARAIASILVAAWSPDGPGLAPSDLPAVPAPRVRPYPGCAPCGHSCTVRPLGRQHRAGALIRASARTRDLDDLAHSAKEWQDRVSRGLVDSLGTSAAADTGRCVVVHAWGDDAPVW